MDCGWRCDYNRRDRNTANIISGAAYSGMTALTSQAAVALAENQGNLSKTLNSLGKNDTVKSTIAQMVISRALNGFDAEMEWTTGNPGNAKLPLLSMGIGIKSRSVLPRNP